MRKRCVCAAEGEECASTKKQRDQKIPKGAFSLTASFVVLLLGVPIM